MALAIIKFLSIENDNATFRIDTGTNPYYILKIGQGIAESSGGSFIEGVSFKTGLQKNEKSDSLFDSDKKITLPADVFSRENCYVQLFSFKDQAGKSPAFSKVIKVPVALHLSPSPIDEYSFSRSINLINMSDKSLNCHRNIPYAEARSLQAGEPSYEDILKAIIHIAAPIVLGVVSGVQTNNNRGASTTTPQIGMLNTILEKFMHGWSNEQNNVRASITQSISHRGWKQNRFSSSSKTFLSKPFTGGAIESNSSLLMPAMQDDVLIKELFAEVQKEALLKLFLENQQAANASNPAASIDLNQLLKLLQAPVPTPAATPVSQPPAPVTTAPIVQPTAPVAPVTTAKSISGVKYYTSLSNKTILSFEASSKIMVNEKEQIVYNKNADIRLRVKLNVVGTPPKQPLTKAIFTFCFKGKENKVLLEKIFKQKDIIPNTVIEFSFNSSELRSMPPGVPVTAVAEMKWLSSKNTEIKTFGTSEVVFADNYLPKSQGKPLLDEKELTDMKLYRSFWNKVWESPKLDIVNESNTGVKKYLWLLQSDLKYCVMFSGVKESNGLMDTKIIAAEKDTGSVTEKAEGRMKAGIELSVSELNKMSTLWGRQPVAEPSKLAALKTISAITGNAFNCIHKITLKGRARERGMVWVVPVLRLYDFVLNKIRTVDESGQVTEVEEETIQLPMPESIRILGLKSN